MRTPGVVALHADDDCPTLQDPVTHLADSHSNKESRVNVSVLASIGLAASSRF